MQEAAQLWGCCLLRGFKEAAGPGLQEAKIFTETGTFSSVFTCLVGGKIGGGEEGAHGEGCGVSCHLILEVT